LSNVPDDLDTKPYRDEHDLDLLRRMEAEVGRGHVPSARSVAGVRSAIQEVRANIATHRREPAGRGAKRGPKKV
jgi:hypothetical protein